MKYIDPKKVYTDKKDLIRILDEKGNLIDKSFKTSLTNKDLLKLYKFMVLSRSQDIYMTQLQRQGRMLTFVPNFGEEAYQVASAATLEKEDWYVPAFRSNAAMLYLGVPLEHMLLYWNGSEKGSEMPKGVNVLPFNIPIATQYSHAAGIAYAMKLKKKKAMTVTVIGNGGTAEGEFHEALNVAAIHNWPIAFTINNNQWAISTPNHLESGSKTLAAKAMAAGIPEIRVDGNDLIASYEVMKEVREWILAGKGPVLVEFVTWRQGPHTTSDNPRVYRSAEQEKEAERWEPFSRIEKYLSDHKVLTEKDKKKVWADAEQIVKDTYQLSVKNLNANIDDVFDHTYEKLTPELAEQKKEAEIFFGGNK